MTLFQATIAIMLTIVLGHLGTIYFLINRMDALTRDLRSESRDLTKELRTEIRELGTKLDTHVLAHSKGDVV